MEREEQKTNAAIEMYPAGTQNSLQFRVGFATGVEWADEHPKEGLWDSEKVMLFLIDAFKELPNGNGTFKLKKECSMEQLLEDLRKTMDVSNSQR